MTIYNEPPPGMCIVPDKDDITKVTRFNIGCINPSNVMHSQIVYLDHCDCVTFSFDSSVLISAQIVFTNQQNGLLPTAHAVWDCGGP